MGKDNYQWIKNQIKIEVNPKLGYDVYVVDFWFKDLKIGKVELDGFDVETERMKDKTRGVTLDYNEGKEWE